MAGRRAPSRQPLVQAQTPKVTDPQTQRALDVVHRAILDLQARRHLEQFTATEPGYVPESGGAEFDFLAADGTWKTVVGAGSVDSVTAGSSMVSVSPTTGSVVVDVVPANFTGIPMSGITFSGTNNRLAKFSGTTLADSTVTDTGVLVTIANALNVTGTADFDSSLLVNSTLTVNGAVDFDSTLNVDGAATFVSTVNIQGSATIGDTGADAHVVNGTVDFNHAVNVDGTLTLSTLTQGSVLFVGAGGVVTQDNASLFFDDANNRLGVGTASPEANTKVHIRTGGGGTASAAGTTLAVETAGANYITIKGPSGSDHGILFSNGSAANDGAILYDNASSTRGFQLHTAGTSRVCVTSAGEVVMGPGLFAPTKSGFSTSMEVSRTAASGRILLTSYGTAIQSTMYLYRARGTPTATTVIQNTDGIGSIAYTGATGAGSSDFFEGARINATATENWTLSANFGTKLEFTTTTNAAGSGGRGIRLTIDHDGTSTFAGALLCNGSFTAGDATTDSHTINGRAALTNTTATASAFTSTQNPTAGTTNTTTAGTLTNSGTYNTTAGALSEYALRAVISATRSAGANNLTNVAIYGTASGGQVNVALQTDAGNVLLNQTGGTFSCAGAGTFTSTLGVTGDFAVNTNKFTVTAASGNTLVAGTLSATGDFAVNTNKFTVAAASGNTVVAGTFTSNGAGDFDSTLNVDGATTLKGNVSIGDAAGDTVAFHGAAGATQQTVTGSRGGNAALADLLTKLANKGIIVDGTTA